MLYRGMDRAALDTVFSDDVIMEWPQSGERIRGARNRREIYGRFPSLPTITPRRLIGEGDFSRELKKLIADHDLHSVIDFVNRVYPLHDIPSLLSDCHVGLVPLDVTPISDVALPLKLVEYTCLGLPSVSVESTAITYYFRPDECMLYPPGDAGALARILDDLAENPGRLEGFRKRLPMARERMSWSREKQKYIAMLQRLAGSRVPLAGARTAGGSTR